MYLDKKYSYADYLTWHFQEKLEFIKGKIFKMSSAPSTAHQRISRKLIGIMISAFKNHSSELFVAPFDVRLLNKKKSTLDQEIYTVIQPDLCVIFDDSKIDERGALGAPDLVIEILSPVNSNKEM